MVTELEVLNLLRDVIDQDTGKKISELGELSVTVNKNVVGVILRVVEQKSPSWEQQFKKHCSAVIRSAFVDVASVTVVLVVLNKRQPAPKIKIQGIGNVILVASGKGGVGKSTVAAQIAIELARRGYSISLVDADIYGPSIPQLLGINDLAEVDDDGMMLPANALGVQSISVGNIISDKNKAIVWRGPMLTKAINKLITGTKWSPSDYMIIDTPPGTGDVHISITHGYHITGAVIVSTPHELSVTQAMKTCDMLKNLDVRLLGIVENMSYFLNNDTGCKIRIFGNGKGQELAEQAGTVLLGDVCIHPNMCLPLVNKRHNAVDEALCNTYETIVSNMLKSIDNIHN